MSDKIEYLEKKLGGILFNHEMLNNKDTINILCDILEILKELKNGK